MLDWLTAEASLGSLAVAAFLAATFVPLSSEVVLVAVLKLHPDLHWTAVGLATLRSGWQTVTFPTRARAWRIGHNDVTLFFKYALPSESGEVRAARLGHISIAQ